jgi:trans-2,3-dihydro-3-hydroxyanthranilate isomerase
MRHAFYLCDVFTDRPFAGNQLAVVTDAVGLSDATMQRIAREFNFSETTFVLPPERGGAQRVRIFTPAAEVPFAGHPNVGTAFVLAETNRLGPLTSPTTVTFEEKAGDVAIQIERRDGRTWCELRAPAPLSLGKRIATTLVASALGLDPADVDTAAHEPRVASVGLPFVFVELKSRSALERARVQVQGFEAIAAEGVAADVYLYYRCAGNDDGVDVRARMFAPFDGVAEDPATGSAGCALAGLLAQREAANGRISWRVAQGVEMGRPSLLGVFAIKRGDVVEATGVGGTSVLVGSGALELA